MNSSLYFSFGLEYLKHPLAAKAPSWKPDRISLSFYRSNYGREIWDSNKQFFDRKFVPFFEKLLDQE